MTAPEWWCEAYGPPADGVDAEAWPRCFLGADPAERHCADARTCTGAMGSERRRVFDRIQQGAADGDRVMQMLAEDLTSPDQLLNGATVAPDEQARESLVDEGPHWTNPGPGPVGGTGFSSSGPR